MNWQEFLTDVQTTTVATVRADGRPHAAPVVFALDGDDIIFLTAATSVKGQNLRLTERAALTFDEQRPPFGFVIVEGPAAMTEDPDEVVKSGKAIADRYQIPEDVFLEHNAVPGQLIVRVTPKRIIQRLDGNPRKTVLDV